MTLYPVLFNQTPPQLRRSGARGGRAAARNRRLTSTAAMHYGATTDRVPGSWQ